VIARVIQAAQCIQFRARAAHAYFAFNWFGPMPLSNTSSPARKSQVGLSMLANNRLQATWAGWEVVGRRVGRAPIAPEPER
jgi:hypothetical protein